MTTLRMTTFAARASAVAALVVLAACGTPIAGYPIAGAPIGPGSPIASSTSAGASTDSDSSENSGSREQGAPDPESSSASAPGAGTGSAHPDFSRADLAADSRFHVPPEDVSTTWDVETKSDAVILDYEWVDTALRSADPSAGRWECDSAAVAAAGIDVGDAILLAGRGMGRVTSIENNGAIAVIHTSEASLADIIDNGTMAWDAAIDFGQTWAVDDTPSGMRAPQFAGAFAVDATGRALRPVPRDTSDGLTKWSFKDGDTNYILQVTPSPGHTDVIIQVTRDELTFVATGTVGAMRSMGSATFKDGKLSKSTVDHDGLGGNLLLKIAAAGAGSGDIKLDVPGLMFKYIVPVGPVPVTMGITAQIIGSVQVPMEASVVFESNFAYDGTAGFSYTGSEVNAKGTLGNMVMDPKAADPVGFIGSTVDAQFGVSFPKVSLSIFEVGLVPSLQPAIYLGTSLTWGPVCKTAYIRAELLLGYELKAFGVSFANGGETLWEDRKDVKGDSCE